MVRAVARVTLRSAILDPQGKATQHALENLGYGQIQDVRVGKLIELTIDAETPDEAMELATKACQQLLANPVTEVFEVVLEDLPDEVQA
jgi:phosphoribosylformylglycinamidine synthase